MTVLDPIRDTLTRLCRARQIRVDDVISTKRSAWLMVHRRAIAKELHRLGYSYRRIDWVFNRKRGTSSVWVDEKRRRKGIDKALKNYHRRKAIRLAADNISAEESGLKN